MATDALGNPIDFTKTTSGGLSSVSGPLFKDYLERAFAASKAPYKEYTGDRVAGLSDLEKKAQTGIAGLNSYSAPTYASQSFTDPGIAGLYMSPYQQNVTDIAKREAQRDADIAATGLDAGAVSKGAFGGYRHGLVEAEHERNTAQKLGDIQAKGLQSAYEMGMKQFESEAERNQRTQYLQDLANRYNYTSGIEALKLQSDTGRLPRELEQKDLEYKYNEYLNKMKYPYENLNFLKGAMGAIPVGAATTSTDSSNYAPPNPWAQGIGAAGTINELFNKNGFDFNKRLSGATGGGSTSIGGGYPGNSPAANNIFSDTEELNLDNLKWD
jgi:hypothetical protein